MFSYQKPFTLTSILTLYTILVSLPPSTFLAVPPSRQRPIKKRGFFPYYYDYGCNGVGGSYYVTYYYPTQGDYNQPNYDYRPNLYPRPPYDPRPTYDPSPSYKPRPTYDPRPTSKPEVDTYRPSFGGSSVFKGQCGVRRVGKQNGDRKLPPSRPRPNTNTSTSASTPARNLASSGNGAPSRPRNPTRNHAQDRNGAPARNLAQNRNRAPSRPRAPARSRNPAQALTRTVNSRIIDGQFAEAGSWPWIAAIGSRKSNNNVFWFCGGTLISPSFVITAAHCVTNTPQRLFVRLGALKIDNTFQNGNSGRDINVARVIEHSGYYNADITYNDIALLILETPAPINDYIQPICLADSSDFGRAGEELLIGGWGKTETEQRAYELKEAVVPAVEENTCKRAYGSNIDSRYICAGGNGKDTCEGDSGGPLVAVRGGKHYLAGIVSFGRVCGDPNNPGVYTRVSHYMDWILERWNGS